MTYPTTRVLPGAGTTGNPCIRILGFWIGFWFRVINLGVRVSGYGFRGSSSDDDEPAAQRRDNRESLDPAFRGSDEAFLASGFGS